MSPRPPSILTRDRARPVLPVPTTGSPMDSAVWAELLGLSQPETVAVTDKNVRGLPALDRAKSLVTGAVTTMLVAATVADPEGRPLPVPSVIRRPHPLYGSYEFYGAIADSLVMHGNYVALKVGDDPDNMTLLPVPLGGVSVDISSGLPRYAIENRIYEWWEVLHIRSNAPVGTFWGVGVVEKFRRGLSEQLHAQAYGENSFKTGSVPSLSVKLDVDNPTSAQTTEAKQGLITKFGSGKREPMVHGRNMELTPLSWSPHDSEFVEARKLTAAEACLMVGLRPEDIGASLGQSMVYANRTDDSLQRITDSYSPWVSLIEEAMSDLLDPGHKVVGNVEALLRTSTRERLELRKLAQEIGVETPEESRIEEGRTALTVSPSDDNEETAE